MRLLNKLINIGVSDLQTDDSNRRTRLINSIAPFVSGMSFIMSFYSIYFDLPHYYITLSFVISVVFLVPVFLNSLGLLVISRVFTIINGYFVLSLLSFLFGPSLHFHLFLIACIGFPLMAFDNEIGLFKWILVIITIPIWLYWEWHFINFEPIINVGIKSSYWIRLTNTFMLFLVMVYLFYVFTKQNNLQIKKLNYNNLEKETLLREIHHRVKNNLQIITSLLSLQSSNITHDKSKELFKDGQNRIKSMALLHEMLYQTNDFRRINYGDYVSQLIAELISSIIGTEKEIDIELNIDNIYLNLDTSLPLGLLINEIITNSLKYGFVDQKMGLLTIKIEEIKYPDFLLEIGDNGIGFSDKVNFGNTSSLGLKLIHQLTFQLDGNVERDYSKNGTYYKIRFREITEA